MSTYSDPVLTTGVTGNTDDCDPRFQDDKHLSNVIPYHASHHLGSADKNRNNAITRMAKHLDAMITSYRSTRIYPYIAKLLRFIRDIWSKRPKSSPLLYFLVFLTLTASSVLLLQWSMYVEPTYGSETAIDAEIRATNSVLGQLTQFVTQIWLLNQYQFILNFLILALIYIIIILLINRFWLATGLFGALVTVVSAANKCKMIARNEPIIPSDLNFFFSGNAGEAVSFIPTESVEFIESTIHRLAWLLVACIVLYFADRRKALIPCTWRPSKFTARTIFASVSRLFASATCIALVVSFAWNLSTPGSWSNRLATKLSDAPQLWNAPADAAANGPLINFLRLSHVSIMKKPDNYDRQAMEQLATKYQNAASEINQARNRDLADNTIIMVLSETFSDPTRLPGVSLAHDPMPNIRAMKTTTTSGYALSTGYGGGTANLEYQALTGLSLANFDPSLSIPYQQLTPNQKQIFTFNQLWNSSIDDSASVAIHPFSHTTYLRSTNYKKFKFGEFYTQDGENQITCQGIDNSPYASDQCAYQNVVDAVKSGSESQFVQLVTMQNHMPYADWYNNNEFLQTEVPASDRYDNTALATFAKGIEYTDTYTVDFLNKLDEIDKPITVVFYGDHLPGIFVPLNDGEKADSVTLRETDYFIWSNTATYENQPLPESRTNQFTSSNYFMAQTAEHLGARVSPYLAFLTQLHEAVPAMTIPTPSSVDPDGPTYLDINGTPTGVENFSDGTMELLQDYKLIQYDQTAGKHYLDDLNFMKLQ